MIAEAREAYIAFLSKYPYCYGYWKKYADIEKRHSDVQNVTEVCVYALYGPSRKVA